MENANINIEETNQINKTNDENKTITQNETGNTSFTTNTTETPINMQEHMLDEEPLTLKLEKSNFEAFAHEKKDDLKSQTQIELNDYMLSNTVTTNKLYKEMQQKVLKDSESIHEAPRRNYKLELEEMEAKKQLLFGLKNTKWDDSVKGFNELLQEINQIIRELQQNNDVPQIQNFVYLSNSTKLSLATAYFFNKKYELGKRLVDELINEHPYYLRPYIKKMEYFHTRGELENAKELCDKLDSLREKLNDKDLPYFLRIRDSFIKDWMPYEQKKNEQLKKAYRGFGKKEEEEQLKKKQAQEEAKQQQEKQKKEQQEAKEKQEQLAKQSEQYLWLKALFGGLLFVGSSFSLFLLFRYKNHFMTGK